MAKTKAPKEKAAKAKPTRPGKMPASDVWIIAMLGALAGGKAEVDACNIATYCASEYRKKYLAVVAVAATEVAA